MAGTRITEGAALCPWLDVFQPVCRVGGRGGSSPVSVRMPHRDMYPHPAVEGHPAPNCNEIRIQIELWDVVVLSASASRRIDLLILSLACTLQIRSRDAQ